MQLSAMDRGDIKLPQLYDMNSHLMIPYHDNPSKSKIL